MTSHSAQKKTSHTTLREVSMIPAWHPFICLCLARLTNAVQDVRDGRIDFNPILARTKVVISHPLSHHICHPSKKPRGILKVPSIVTSGKNTEMEPARERTKKYKVRAGKPEGLPPTYSVKRLRLSIIGWSLARSPHFPSSLDLCVGLAS
ncbi:hypothetical protein FNV43_RR00623 [Rhamnella rubrinervis]|uniref:Uncharacterized protein n=1 Tax=Rhamnella rubrinervis TaxID=2594499 RepID=A0A8K0HP05_9ROSA|nr:hypothetical protein FNV43_RR00623 [Rhamnella rubrinervis]